ncbi:glycosyltransferase, partial [Candidatus Roizmanbacteria bacterium]|nr:glycosyltransferase [Candidatus Roizmanbacteria bacterium]
MLRLNLSIIILSYNTKELTKNCLESILKSLTNSSLNYEIIVVDNHSTDGSVED